MTSTRESRKVIYQGRIFSLEVDRVTLPSGHTVDMEIVRHPGSVVLLPMPTPGEVILIRQYRYSIDRWIWELPAGSLKPKTIPIARRPASAKRRSASCLAASSGCAALSDAGILRRGDDLLYRCSDIAVHRRPIHGEER